MEQLMCIKITLETRNQVVWFDRNEGREFKGNGPIKTHVRNTHFAYNHVIYNRNVTPTATPTHRSHYKPDLWITVDLSSIF